MRIEKINGIPVPYDLSIEELGIMLASSDMSDFVVACEALSYKSESKAYELLKNYITNKDKYKSLAVLKTIFRHPMSSELMWFLEDSILSDDILFVENGLKIVSEYEMQIPKQVILSAVSKHFHNLYCTTLYVLKILDANENNYFKLLKFYNLSAVSGQKQIISEILCEKYLPEKSRELFNLFSKDNFSTLRLLAVKIGKEYNFDISKLCEDVDGHVRKEARKK